MGRKMGARKCTGLALGSGSARGWAHIGVIETLLEQGIRPDVVCGTSVGAIVAAAYCSGRLQVLREWLLGLDRLQVARLLDPAFLEGGGAIKGVRLFDSLADIIGSPDIESLPVPFGAVATSLANGEELWLQSGPLLDAVRASIALPGFFTPVARDNAWLVDGGLVNPVPVSLCHSMGATHVIAVDLNADLLTHDAVGPVTAGRPGIIDVMAASISIMQERITRGRLALDVPTLIIRPALGHLGVLDYHRAEEAIEAGRVATQKVLARGEFDL